MYKFLLLLFIFLVVVANGIKQKPGVGAASRKPVTGKKKEK